MLNKGISDNALGRIAGSLKLVGQENIFEDSFNFVEKIRNEVGDTAFLEVILQSIPEDELMRIVSEYVYK